MRRLSKIQSAWAYAVAVAFLYTGSISAASVNVNLYSTGSENTSTGLTFSGYDGSLTATDIQFYTDNGGAWFPSQVGGFGSSFGADITTDLSVASAGTYSFSYGSDDDSYIFLDGSLVSSEPGGHGYYSTTFNESLSAGLHPLEVQFYNGPCCGSGVDFNPPTGVTFATSSSTPEPTTISLVAISIAGLVFMRRRKGFLSGASTSERR